VTAAAMTRCWEGLAFIFQLANIVEVLMQAVTSVTRCICKNNTKISQTLYPCHVHCRNVELFLTLSFLVQELLLMHLLYLLVDALCLVGCHYDLSDEYFHSVL